MSKSDTKSSRVADIARSSTLPHRQANNVYDIPSLKRLVEKNRGSDFPHQYLGRNLSCDRSHILLPREHDLGDNYPAPTCECYTISTIMGSMIGIPIGALGMDVILATEEVMRAEIATGSEYGKAGPSFVFLAMQKVLSCEPQSLFRKGMGKIIASRQGSEGSARRGLTRDDLRELVEGARKHARSLRRADNSTIISALNTVYPREDLKADSAFTWMGYEPSVMTVQGFHDNAASTAINTKLA